MSGNFVAQVAPMGHVARVVLQEQEAGLIKQQALQQVITQHLSKDNEQVQKTSAGEQGQRVRRRKQGREREPDGKFEEELAEQLAKQLEDPDQGAPPPELEEPPGPGGNVWAGNIVNVKV